MKTGTMTWMPGTVVVLATVVCLCGLRSTANAELVLAADGKAACTVVGGADDGLSRSYSILIPGGNTQIMPTHILRRAADDLAHYLNRMMGGPGQPGNLVGVVTDKAGAKTPVRILLGSAAIEEYGLAEEAKKLSYSGYICRTRGNDLLIFGSSNKGTANGVYGFLQDELGMRWFGPQEFHRAAFSQRELFTVVPKPGRIVIGDIDRTVEPSFHGRLGHRYNYLEDPVVDWGRRLRAPEPYGGYEPFSNASHNIDMIFADRYWDTHPEYYYMVRGKRHHGENRLHDFSVCYSNPGVVEVATMAALDHFRASPFHQSFSLGITDGFVYCECDECAKLQPAREFRGARVASDMYYHFVNAVARKVAVEFPDRYLGAIAYNDVTAPPVGPMEKNVFVMLVNDISEYYDSAYRAQDDELVRGWQEKGITLGMYYYAGLAKLVPAYFPHLLAEQLKDKHRRGFRALISESYPGWPWNGPMAYVEARLWWDVNLDPDALLNEYFSSLFGPAAEPMSRLYALFEEIHMRPRNGGFLSEHYKFLQFRPYTGDDLVRMRAELAAAHAAVTDPTLNDPGLFSKRVAYVSSGLQVFLEMLEGAVLAREIEAADDPADDVAALDRLEKIERISTLMQRHDALYRETIDLDPFQSGRYAGDRCTPVRKEWRAAMREALVGDLARLRLWAKKEPPHPVVRSRLKDVLAFHMRDPIGRATILVKCREAKLGPNRVDNPGFEELPAGAAPDAPDVAAANADKWGSYPGPDKLSGGVIDVVDTNAFKGKRAGRLVNVVQGNFNSMVMPVKPDELYLFSAMAKCSPTPGEQLHRVSISHLWTKPQGGWDFALSSEHRYEADLQRTGEWQKLETVVKVPDGAGGIALMLNASKLTGGQEVLFDEVSFRRIILPPAR